jgi:integrase
VNLEKGFIRVVQRADLYNTIGRPKSAAGNRRLQIGPALRHALAQWKLNCPPSPGKLVFPSPRGRILTTSQIHKIWKPFQASLNMLDDYDMPLAPLYNLHCLRHACASLLIDEGWNAKRIQVSLGHATIQMTFDLYGHL